ncbi:MAG: hypothetical protein AABZ47_04155 [Planctomycetota bacterium]
MPLTVNRDVDHYVDLELRTLPVAAAKHIYKGGFIGSNSAGYAQPLVAGDPFAGIAYEEADNTTGAAGAMTVRVYTFGDFGHALSGATIAHMGRPVFASADNTLTFDGAGQSYLGFVQDVPANGQIVLRIDVTRQRIKTVTHVVEDLAAGADIAARAVHGFDSEGWVVSARVVNQTTAAAGINDSNTCVVALATGAGSIASKTFDTANVFPAANSQVSMGTINNAHVTPGSVLTLAVTNGTTANPGIFLVEVDYV